MEAIVGASVWTKREQLQDGVRMTSARGVLTMRRPAHGLWLGISEGYSIIEVCDEVLRSRSAVIQEDGSITIFEDAETVVGYDPALRPRIGEWRSQNESRIVGYHLLFRSRLLAMALEVSNMLIRNPGKQIIPYTDRSKFYGRLTREIASVRASREGRAGAS